MVPSNYQNRTLRVKLQHLILQMSVSDPLLKQLKALTLEFRLSEGIVNDSSEKLEPFCEILEKIFRKGLKQNGGWFSRTDYWCWIHKLLDSPVNQRINPIFSMVTEIVKESKKVNNLQGRGRLFIRYALVKKILGLPVELLMKNRQMAETWYHSEHSIIGNEILSEIFISLLFEITEIRFLFNLKNASFLDETWELPIYKEYELVPCDDIGMTVQYLVGRTLVRNVAPGSVAEEDGKIGCGDVLDELFGVCLRDASKSKVQYILRQNSGWPIRLAVTKCHTRDGCIYPPIEELMVLANLNRDQVTLTPVEEVAKKKEFEDEISTDESDFFRPTVEKGRKPAHALLPIDDTDEIPVHGSEQNACYSVLFIGEVFLGNDGGQDRILDVIGRSMVNYPGKQEPFILQLGETELIISTRDQRKVVYRHSFTEISSCGRRMDSLKVFAYVAGETTCRLARKFTCRIFEAENPEEAKIILCAIGQGFDRTSFFV